MTNNRILTVITVCSTLFISAPSFATVLPLQIGADAGITNIKYKGLSGTGYVWTISGTLKLNHLTRIYSGYSETTADIPNSLGQHQHFISTSIPLALQINLPMVLGDLYLRGGGNYYSNTYGTESDDGWGMQAAIGFSLAPTIGPGMSFEIGYKDQGNAETSSISAGAKFNF